MSRAQVAALLARVDAEPAAIRSAPADLPGFTRWFAPGRRGGAVTTILPTVKATAPDFVHRQRLDFVTASLTGRCPRCDAVSGHLRASLEMVHADSCDLLDSIDPWLEQPSTTNPTTGGTP